MASAERLEGFEFRWLATKLLSVFAIVLVMVLTVFVVLIATNKIRNSLSGRHGNELGRRFYYC